MIGKIYTQGNISEEKQRMAKTLYKAKFKDKLPLGGIGTGHIPLGCDGSILCHAKTFFVIKAEKDGELFDARVLQSTENQDVVLPFFEKSEAVSFFPFTEICFSDSSFPADVKMTAYSPFIPLNDTDSGIPAVSFEFEIKNKSDERIDYSLCLVSSNLNKDSYNRMGCTDTGEAYIHLYGEDEDDFNTCISTSGKNVSFCEYTSIFDFTKNFIFNSTLCNMTKYECSDSFLSGALCTHFSLAENEVSHVSYCFSWYFPQNKFSKNYYAQYFESSLECASYFFRQKDRLFSNCMEFCENVFGATLPESVLEEANRDLFAFSGENLIRLDDGSLISEKEEEFCDMDSFLMRSGVLPLLFPKLCCSETLHFYKSGLYETASSKELLLSVLKDYRHYILTADTDGLIDNWYYIVKCAEKLFGEDGKNRVKESDVLTSPAISALFVMADAVKDKKRAELYSQMLENTSPPQQTLDISGGFSKIYGYSGFSYNAVDKSIAFSPRSDECPLDEGGTFRSFFCTPTCYGYVEEGIDYIEINILSGSLTVRSFSVPRTPRLVQYGGRNWKFTDTHLCALLDSDLEISHNKKLTIFIDIKG